MEQRITRSTLAGGRVESGDRGLASPAKQSPIPCSGSFTEAYTVSAKGRAGLGRAVLAGLRWQGDRAAADTPCTGKRRWVWAPVRSSDSDSLLGELHRGVHNLLRGSDGVGKGSADRSTVAGGLGGRGHAVHGQTPTVLGSGEVERVRRGTVKVPGCFIGAGAGHGAGWTLARRGARGARVGRALASLERVEHVVIAFCPCSCAC